jgi:hypothetical protein
MTDSAVAEVISYATGHDKQFLISITSILRIIIMCYADVKNQPCLIFSVVDKVPTCMIANIYNALCFE